MPKIPIIIKRKWIDLEKANLLTHQISNSINWEQPKVRVYGKEFLVPRLTSFLAILWTDLPNAEGEKNCFIIKFSS